MTLVFPASHERVTLFTSAAEFEFLALCIIGARKFECFVVLETLVSCKLMAAYHATLQTLFMSAGAEAPPTGVLTPVFPLLVEENKTFVTHEIVIKHCSGVEDAVKVTLVTQEAYICTPYSVRSFEFTFAVFITEDTQAVIGHGGL